MRVIYHPAAEAELIQAAEYYERQVPSLGSQFLDAIEDAATGIIESPKRWPLLENGVRRFLLPRFPFAIYYRTVGGQHQDSRGETPQPPPGLLAEPHRRRRLKPKSGRRDSRQGRNARQGMNL
jgi:plasmid stabilization system protein ParE